MNAIKSQLPGIQRIPVGNLLLDGDNPRLPERLHRGSQSELLIFSMSRAYWRSWRSPTSIMASSNMSR